MKKLTNKIKNIFSLILLSVGFISCHDNIFEMINNEVALENYGINGTINSFVRHSDYIWLANGNIYYKTNKSSLETGLYNKQWKKIQNPKMETSSLVPVTYNYLASDDEYIYTMAIEWDENSSGINSIVNKKLFCAQVSDPKSITWNEIDLTSITGDSNKATSVKIIFDNQAYEDTNRNTYAKIYDSVEEKYCIYKLDGTNCPSEKITDNGANESTCNAVYFPKDGKDYFSKYYAMGANDSLIYYSLSHTEANILNGDSKLYYANGWSSSDGFTYEKDGNTVSAISVNLDSGYIFSIGVTSNYLLLGTANGLAHVLLDSTTLIPNSKTNEFSDSNNADSIISEYVLKVFILDPTKMDDVKNNNGTDEYCCSTIYGSITGSADTFKESGLYAYYPERGTWNRDGTSNKELKGN